jgi:serine/threonine-protein kinase
VIVSGLAIGLAGAAGYFAGAGRSPSPAMSWLDLAPEDLNAYDAPAVSPDGRSIVFSAKGRLWLRPTDSPRAEPLPGTEGARLPFWSPDSQSVAFGSSATGQLSRLDLRAGVTAPVRLCPIAQFRGGAWLPDDTILLAETWSPILKVPASGGTPVPLTHLDKEKGEGSHRFPTALPGGRFLYFSYTSAVSDAAIWVASVSNPSDRQLVVKSRSHAEYANGYLFYVSAGSLVAQRFDPRTGQLSGKQIVITARVGATDIAGRHAFAASPAGTLVYVMPHTTLRQLAVVDRKGVVVRRIRGEEATYSVELSPDGDRVALTRDSETISIVNVQTEGDQPLFDGPDTGERWPVWSRDRKELFVSLPQGPFGNYNLFKVSPSGGPATPATIPDPQRMGAAGVGADGTLYWFGFVPASLGEDIFRQASGASKSEPFMTTAGSSEGPGRVSHDGKWIAYATTTAKDTQVVVRSLIDKGQSAMVSVSGGLQPRWGVLDKEIYFVAPDRWLMAAAIQLTPALKAERPQRLFPMDLLDCYDYCYDVFGDGNFLVNPVTTRGVPRLTVVQHWLGDSR